MCSEIRLMPEILRACVPAAADRSRESSRHSFAAGHKVLKISATIQALQEEQSTDFAGSVPNSSESSLVLHAMEWIALEKDEYYPVREMIMLPEGNFIIAVDPRLFAQVGIVGMWENHEGMLQFSWCCGTSNLMLSATWEMLKKIIAEGKVTIKEIPKDSAIRPWFNDQEFVDQVLKLMSKW